MSAAEIARKAGLDAQTTWLLLDTLGVLAK
jgi:hypothetical protein